MKNQMMVLSMKLRSLVVSDEGQDLIEYALVVALIAFAATAGMTAVAGGINTAFNNIALKLANYTG